MRGSLFSLLPLRVKCQNHERVPISPISAILVVHASSDVKTLTMKIGEIGTLSWFWHFTLRGNGPSQRFPWVKCQNHERAPISPILVVHVSSDVKTLTMKIGEIGEIGTLSWFWHFALRGNRGNRDPLSVFPG